ncbi:helix-turn-helix domain-containing protein [Vibrio sp. WJH972]
MKNQKSNKTQFDITNEIIQSTNPELKGTEKAVLVTLSSYLNDEGNKGVFKASPSRATLSSKSSFGLSAIDRALKKLEDLNYISSEQRMDNSKVYTWKGFEAEKTPEVLAFEKALVRKREAKKEFDRVRGANLGRNNAEVKKLEGLLEINSCEKLEEELKLVKEARSKNVYFREYEPYTTFKTDTRKKYFTAADQPTHVETPKLIFSKKANSTQNEDFTEERQEVVFSEVEQVQEVQQEPQGDKTLLQPFINPFININDLGITSIGYYAAPIARGELDKETLNEYISIIYKLDWEAYNPSQEVIDSILNILTKVEEKELPLATPTKNTCSECGLEIDSHGFCFNDDCLNGSNNIPF